MYHCGMRKVEEKHVANQVDLMVWSNRLDLLALSNFKGEVQVHRLRLQKVCTFPPPNENVTVTAMAWRPDGKALAIGYSCRGFYIVDVEDKKVLEKYELEPENPLESVENKSLGISSITWAVREGTLDCATEYNIYDDASLFIQTPPSTSREFKNPPTNENFKDFKEVQEPTQLNMLLVGYGRGFIYMSISGKYPYGTIFLPQVLKDEYGEYKILDTTMSDDFSIMQVLYCDRVSNNIFVALINTSVLSAYAEEIFIVANKHSQVVRLVGYLDQTMVAITEAWEHILLEMDNKMAYFAASVPEGGVSADLLELLMLGVPSDVLELFLLQELTAKGLKKFGSSVELSYSTIQKLVLKQLNILSQSITYYLAELRGLTRVPDRFKIMGLEESTVTEAIKACCAFFNKCLELQQVIDVSMRNYKAFFRWLFVVIVRLLDEQTPSDIVKITQQELMHIAEFLYNFDSVQAENAEPPVPDKPVRFNLERLGQYLQDQDLTLFPDDEDNPWHKFLKENSCFLKDSDTFYSMTEFRKFSLVQQQKYLKNAIHNVFDMAQKDVAQHFSVLFNVRCYEGKSDVVNNLRYSQHFDSTHQRFMTAFMNTSVGKDGLCFMSFDVKNKSCVSTAVKYYFTNLMQDTCGQHLGEDHMDIQDLQFYSSEYLSVLINQPGIEESTIFVQLPLKVALDNSQEFNVRSQSCVFTDKIIKRNISPLLDPGVYKVLDKMDGFKIAVSGGRKVAVVLAKSYRKVRVFEMEADGEDEEDETLDITPQSQSTRRSDEQATPDTQDVSTENTTF